MTRAKIRTREGFIDLRDNNGNPITFIRGNGEETELGYRSALNSIEESYKAGKLSEPKRDQFAGIVLRTYKAQVQNAQNDVLYYLSNTLSEVKRAT